MKVRWTDASLRLRITPTELAALVLGEGLHSSIALPGSAGWLINVRPGADRPDLRWSDGGVELLLTAADVARLAEGDREGVYFATGGDHPIRYFVEKDFPCAHPHPVEAQEPETERFAPTESYLRRRQAIHGHA